MQALGALVPLMRARTEIMAKTDILTTLCGRNPVLAQCCWHGDPASLFTFLARWRRRWRREIGKHCCILMTICMLGLSLLAPPAVLANRLSDPLCKIPAQYLGVRFRLLVVSHVACMCWLSYEHWSQGRSIRGTYAMNIPCSIGATLL